MQLASDALALVLLGGEHLFRELLQLATVFVEDVEHVVQRVAQTGQVRVREEHGLGAGSQIAGGDPIDRSFERVERLERQVEHGGVDEQAAGEEEHQHEHDRHPADVAVRASDERQREPGAEANAQKHDHAVRHEHLQEQRDAEQGLAPAAR